MRASAPASALLASFRSLSAGTNNSERGFMSCVPRRDRTI
jgi:hypothetical protein